MLYVLYILYILAQWKMLGDVFENPEDVCEHPGDELRTPGRRLRAIVGKKQSAHFEVMKPEYWNHENQHAGIPEPG